MASIWGQQLSRRARVLPENLLCRSQHAQAKWEGAETARVQAVLQPLQRDPQPAGSPGFSALPALPSLCHRLHLLGHFQLCQYFIPLDKVLGEKQDLDVTHKERDVENPGKKPRSERPGSSVTTPIPWERKQPGAPGCRKPVRTQTMQALSRCAAPNTNGHPEGTSEHHVELCFKGLSMEKSRAPLPTAVLGCVPALGSYTARTSHCLAQAGRRDQQSPDRDASAPLASASSALARRLWHCIVPSCTMSQSSAGALARRWHPALPSSGEGWAVLALSSAPERSTTGTWVSP